MNSAKLSPQQATIMQHLVNGSTVKEIAMRMKLSSVSVRKHINKTKRKLGAKTHDHTIALVVARGDVIVALDIANQKLTA